jgi:hypothetical protein
MSWPSVVPAGASPPAYGWRATFFRRSFVTKQVTGVTKQVT